MNWYTEDCAYEICTVTNELGLLNQILGTVDTSNLRTKISRASSAEEILVVCDEAIKACDAATPSEQNLRDTAQRGRCLGVIYQLREIMGKLEVRQVIDDR